MSDTQIAKLELNDRQNTIFRQKAADTQIGDPRWNETREGYMDLHDAGRYYYDFELLKGWKQYDTTQDASYFGVWVNVEERKIFTYAEGDRTLVVCPNQENFGAELKNMAEFYGDPPPAFVVYSDIGDGKMERTEVFDTRPEAV